MRIGMAALLFCGGAAAAVVDRVAVVVGDAVITESEVLQELRLTEFQNGQSLDLSPGQRRAAAERLVDQQLIRSEMQLGHYPEPSPGEAEGMLVKFRREHFNSIPQFRSALERYSMTEDELKQRLAWQLATIRFTDQRFRPDSGSAVDQQMNTWLAEARGNTRIQFRKEAFQ